MTDRLFVVETRTQKVYDLTDVRKVLDIFPVLFTAPDVQTLADFSAVLYVPLA